MPQKPNTWALVLAAGEGSRLRSLTTPPSGATVPKQFCSLYAGPSLLAEAAVPRTVRHG
jgi:mannose-1-phosphate guanylyltransferase